MNVIKCYKTFKGIGPKVADCIMLFQWEKDSAFPVDVWVKRAMQHFYLAPDVSLKENKRFCQRKVWRVFQDLLNNIYFIMLEKII